VYLTHKHFFFSVALYVQFNISPHIGQLLNGLSCSSSKLQFQITANKKQRLLIYLFLQTLYMFQPVPPPIIRSTELYIQLQVLSNNTAASCYRERDGLNSISSTVAASSNIALQYLKLYVQLCAPDDGRWNRLKHVEHL
jgi:hypothetical protein